MTDKDIRLTDTQRILIRESKDHIYIYYQSWEGRHSESWQNKDKMVIEKK